MTESGDDLRALRSRARDSGIGRRFVVSDETASTNRDALAWLDEAPESPHGVVFLTVRQTAGRGTRGRTWWSPEDAALAMSIVVAPRARLPRPAAITLVAALATNDAASELGAATSIRWPNDLVDASGAKLCGILAEVASLEPPRFVVGIGLNCATSRYAPPPDLRTPHSDLVRAGAKPTPRVEIALTICAALDRRLDEFLRAGLAPVVRDFNARSWLRGRRVELAHGARIVCGTFDSIDDEFRILGRDDDGGRFALPCEQVELRRHD